MTGRLLRASRLQDPGIALTGLFACFHQVVVLVAGNVWPPVAMVHEIFGTNYFALGYRLITPFFVETGYGSLALLAYPAYAIAALVVDAGDMFQRMAVFGITFHVLVGTTTFAVFCFVWKGLSRPREALLLLCVPLAPLVLEPASVLNLVVNYSRAQEILGMVTAALFIARFVRWKESNRHLVVVAGGLLGIAVSVKFTNVLLFGPLLIAVALPCEKDFRETLRIAVRFTIAATAAFTVVIAVYGLFSWRLFVFDFNRIFDLYTAADWVRQNTPFLKIELLSLSPNSHYLALKVAMVALVGLLSTLPTGWRLQTAWARRAIVLALLPVAFLVWMLTVRTALGTMLDIVVYVAILFVVLTIAVPAGRRARFVPALVVGTVVVAAFVYVVHPHALLVRLRHNSQVAAEIEAMTRTNLPIVFYQAGLPQPILFPSARQICIYKASASPAYQTLTSVLCPGTRTASPDQPLLPGAHVAIIPEYLIGLPDSPTITSEWPQKWSKVAVDFAALDPAGRLRRCRVFQFQELWSAAESLLYYAAYPTRVIVCRIDAADHPHQNRGNQ